ncbi:phosphoribosylformylglycinamidine cyclo-ligase [uncultured Tyzzerella sp.]|uniref:phosphoribosylformylglycinamidine cyclo-ligase n=1 Tax=uncultured Tyzzerella sp. TaxID=2321398 RepID=UPI00294358F2|nr:phosphoribosylformylglycinamidine cyclo-ligase [uncultured Tyzzerella sp.]
MDYKSAGVDVEAGYKSVELMKEHVKATFRKEVLTDLGGFGGLFSIEKAKDMKQPVLVSGTDGVGTKLKLAFLADKHDTIGIDAVAMCVNDIVCSGAEPLFFLDYIACGKNYPEKIAKIVEGVSKGCVMAGCSLIGGETAEMPGFYPEDEYDLAGFTVGILDNANVIDGKKIKDGDVLIGVSSSGIHSNGYSLVRKIFNPNKENINEYIDELSQTLGEALLTPTKIYVKTVLELIKKVDVKGISHITGGGFVENIPRIIPKGLKVNVEDGSFPVLPIFELIMKKGNVDKMDMYKTFNMGIGLVLVVDKDDVEKTISCLKELNEDAFVIGNVTKGEGIEICLK